MSQVGTDLLVVMNELLRSPAAIAERCRQDPDLRVLVGGSMLAIVVGGALFGAALGAPRGALQAAYAGIKLPLAMLAALVICAPAFHVLNAGLTNPQPFRSIVALTLAATARAALVLLACTPALWLGMDTVLGYHQAVLAASFCYCLAGLAAMGVVLRGLGGGWRGLVTAAMFVCVLLPVGGQTAWMLRPFLGRPAQTEVPFLRARESSFADSVTTSVWSAMGIYREVGQRVRGTHLFHSWDDAPSGSRVDPGAGDFATEAAPPLSESPSGLSPVLRSEEPSDASH